MYSINVEPEGMNTPDINRRMSCDAPMELMPVILEICRVEFNYVNPVVIYQGDGIIHVFDLNNPVNYARVQIRKVGDV